MSFLCLSAAMLGKQLTSFGHLGSWMDCERDSLTSVSDLSLARALDHSSGCLSAWVSEAQDGLSYVCCSHPACDSANNDHQNDMDLSCLRS